MNGLSDLPITNERCELAIEDAALIKQAQRGDRTATRKLVLNHQDDVYYLALGLLGNQNDAEDAMQETFIKAIKNLHRFRGDSNLATWLYRVATNTCRDIQRKRRWKWFSLDTNEGQHMLEENTDSHPAPDRDLANSEAKAALHKAMQKLSINERQVFVLRQFQELSVRDTAEVLGIAEGSVKTLLFRAMRKLRGCLAPHQLEGANV